MNIKRKLITLFLAIGLIPMLAVGVVSYLTINRELTSNARTQVQSTAIKQGQKIGAQLQSDQEQVSQLSNDYDLQVALSQYLANTTSNSSATLDQVIQNKKNAVANIQSISVIGLNGSTIASTVDGRQGQMDAEAKAFLSSHQDSAVAIRKDPRDNLEKLYSYTSLTVNKGKAAVMTVVFRIDDITATVQDYTGLGATGETIVAQKDAQGRVISQFPLRFDTEAALTTSLDSLNLFDHGDGAVYMHVKDYRGHEVIVATDTAGPTNWVVAAKIDSSEALAPISQLQSALIAIAAVATGLIILVAVYFSRFFTRPILRIASISQKIGRGDFSAHIDLHRSDEFGSLADSINSMGSSLREFVAHIDGQRRRLEVILNSTEEAILAIDSQGKILTANRATVLLTGLPVDKLVGAKMSDIFGWTQKNQPVVINYDDPSTNYPDLQYVDHDNAQHFVSVSVAHVTNADGLANAQTIVTIHDETKSRELEAMKIDFVSMAAHELRTPLAAIRGYLELIAYKEQSVITPATQKYLSQAVKSTSELGALINNLLDVTRIERGTLTLNFAKVDLAADVSQAVRDARFAAGDKNISLTYAGPPSGYFVEADPIAVHEVVNNLVSNAIKYTNRDGHVAVSILRKGPDYEVAVKDTGIGIPKPALANLFTKFYRVHGGLNSDNPGTGLGLFISKSIIDRHNGTINVESHEGVGSTFRFTLPVLSETRAAEIEKRPEDATNARRKRGWTTKNIAR